MNQEKKKKTIVVSVRLSEEEILKGIQIFILNNQRPYYLADIVKEIFYAGIKATYGNDAEKAISKRKATEILDILTGQRIRKPAFNLKVKNNKLSRLTVSEEQELNCKNAELLAHLSLEDKSAGFMILKNLEKTNDIISNLNSENKTIRRLTAELFFPICHGMPEEELIKEVYTITRTCS